MPDGQLVPPQYHATLEQNYDLPKEILHLHFPMIDRVDAIRPEATWLYSRGRIVQQIAPDLQRLREHVAPP